MPLWKNSDTGNKTKSSGFAYYLFLNVSNKQQTLLSNKNNQSMYRKNIEMIISFTEVKYYENQSGLV